MNWLQPMALFDTVRVGMASDVRTHLESDDRWLHWIRIRMMKTWSSRVALIALFFGLVVPLLGGCRHNKDSDPNHKVGEIEAQSVDVYVHLAEDPLAGTFGVQFTNTTGTPLAGVAELFLFHDFSETHTTLTTALGELEAGKPAALKWRLPAAVLAHELQAIRSYTKKSTRMYYHFVPNRFLIFLRTKKGVFEVTYSSYNEYFPEPDGRYPQRLHLFDNSREVRNYILKRGIVLPE